MHYTHEPHHSHGACMLANDRLVELSAMATRMPRFVRRTNPPRHAARTAAHATLRREGRRACQTAVCVLLSRCAELPPGTSERMGGAGRQPSDAGRRAAKAESCPSKLRRQSYDGSAAAQSHRPRARSAAAESLQPATDAQLMLRASGWPRVCGLRALRRARLLQSQPRCHGDRLRPVRRCGDAATALAWRAGSRRRVWARYGDTCTGVTGGSGDG